MRIFSWVLTVIQALLLAAAYGVQTYSMKKMGVMRHIVYLNQKWEKNYPIEMIKNGAIIILIGLTISVALYIITKRYSRRFISNLAIGVITTSIFTYFTLVYSPAEYRSYYIISMALGIIALLQYIKTIVLLKSYKV